MAPAKKKIVVKTEGRKCPKHRAADAKGKVMRGLDGTMYKSVKSDDGKYRWRKVVKKTCAKGKVLAKDAKGKTRCRSIVALKREKCSKKGKVYDTKTHQCRTSKRQTDVALPTKLLFKL